MSTLMSSKLKFINKIGDYQITSQTEEGYEAKRDGQSKKWIIRKNIKSYVPNETPNINCVQITEVITNNLNENFIVFEKCDDNLEKYMQKRKLFWFSIEQIYDILSQIVNGILHLRKTNQIRSPILRPECIQIKQIGDAEIIKIDNYLLSEPKPDRTLKYFSPEQMNENLSGTQEQCLIYQLGIILYQLCFDSYPKELQSVQQFHQHIYQQPFRCPKFEKPNGQPLINLIERMIVFRAKGRITFPELLMDPKLQPRFFQAGNYLIDFKKKIGSGMQGIIYNALDLNTEVQCCAKVLDSNMIETQKEIEIYTNLRGLDQHPNIINVLDILEEESQKIIILELGDENLEEYCQKQKIDNATIYSFLNQIVDGYLHLKKLNIIHRDLKPQNILIKKINNDSVIKIIDFGVGKIMGSNRLTQTIAGTPIYQAPEVLLGQDYSDQCDIYSVKICQYYQLGAMLFQILYGQQYCNPQNYEQLVEQVSFLKSTPFKCPQPDQINIFFRVLVENMLIFYPYERLTWEELKEIIIILKPQFDQNNLFKPRDLRGSLLKQNTVNVDLKYLDSVQIFSSKVEKSLYDYITQSQPHEFLNDLQSLLISVIFFGYGALYDFYELSDKCNCFINKQTLKIAQQDTLNIKKAHLSVYLEMMFNWMSETKNLVKKKRAQQIFDDLYTTLEFQRITFYEPHSYYQKIYQYLKEKEYEQLAKLPLRLRYFLEKMANLLKDYPMENKNTINYSELMTKIINDDICNNYLTKNSIFIKK